jgi:hypothetical protein
MSPLGPLEGLPVLSLIDMAPSRAVAAWNTGDANPLIRSFVHLPADPP